MVIKILLVDTYVKCYFSPILEGPINPGSLVPNIHIAMVRIEIMLKDIIEFLDRFTNLFLTPD